MPEEDVHVGYLGVVPFDGRCRRARETPRLLYLGRLKRYKRIELLLDVVEAIPDAVLDIAGEGDHRPALEAEIARRGLATASCCTGTCPRRRRRRCTRRRG